MPAAEIEAWTLINDKGVLVVIPRPALAIREWDAASRSYTAYDPLLAGAPVTAAEIDAYYASVVQKLKRSPYVGAVMLDALATSVRTADMKELEKADRDYGVAFDGEFSNRWTEIVLSTSA
jgi:hypothetical protein